MRNISITLHVLVSMCLYSNLAIATTSFLQAQSASGSYDQLVAQATALLDKGEHKKAFDLSIRIQKKNAKRWEGYFLGAKAQFKMGSPAAAERLMKEAKRYAPTSKLPLVDRALADIRVELDVVRRERVVRQLELAGRYAEAAIEAERLLAIRPSRTDFGVNAALFYMKAGNVDGCQRMVDILRQKLSGGSLVSLQPAEQWLEAQRNAARAAEDQRQQLREAEVQRRHEEERQRQAAEERKQREREVVARLRDRLTAIDAEIDSLEQQVKQFSDQEAEKERDISSQDSAIRRYESSMERWARELENIERAHEWCIRNQTFCTHAAAAAVAERYYREAEGKRDDAAERKERIEETLRKLVEKREGVEKKIDQQKREREKIEDQLTRIGGDAPTNSRLLSLFANVYFPSMDVRICSETDYSYSSTSPSNTSQSNSLPPLQPPPGSPSPPPSLHRFLPPDLNQ
jgi:tetratricopeptide (TPR) repeat protein